MSTPKGTATAAATSRPSGLPGPSSDPASPATSAMANAPTPTNVICASEIWPAHPVSGTSDSMISAVISASVSRRRLVGSRPPNCATNATTSTSAAMPTTARRRLGTFGTRCFGTSRPTSRRASGSASNATKRITAGIAVDAVPHRPPHCRKLRAKLCVTPMISPPTNVHGRLRSRPMIAAANASTMKSVNTSTRNPTLGASRMPAIAAIDEPRAHANDDTRPGRTPCNAASSRLSTTARIATPVRLR